MPAKRRVPAEALSGVAITCEHNRTATFPPTDASITHVPLFPFWFDARSVIPIPPVLSEVSCVAFKVNLLTTLTYLFSKLVPANDLCVRISESKLDIVPLLMLTRSCTVHHTAYLSSSRSLCSLPFLYLSWTLSFPWSTSPLSLSQ